MTPSSQANAQAEKQLEQNPKAQRLWDRLAFRRIASGLFLITALGLFLWWLPEQSRRLLVASIVANRQLLFLLLSFGLIMLSLLWSVGQRLDVVLFKVLNGRGYRAPWVDKLMWLTTQLGSTAFITILVVVFYAIGYRRFAVGLTLGALTLLLVVTIIKAFADRARPFNLMLETRVIGWREAGLSFPSGHTTQTFFIATILTNYFALPLAVALVLYGTAATVGITRVYLGVHYPRDVMAGAALGLIWGTMCIIVAPYLVSYPVFFQP